MRTTATPEEIAAEVAAEPRCPGGHGPHFRHAYEIGERTWRCMRCGYRRPPRPVVHRGGWSVTPKAGRPPKELVGQLPADPEEVLRAG